MSEENRNTGRLLAEILRLQRWAGGEAVSAARIFGLMHGFESVLEEEQSRVVSRQTQDAVEDVLEDVEAGKQSVDGNSIKTRLRQSGVRESDAALVMQLCWLQNRFTDAVEKIAQAPGSPFRQLLRQRSDERNWHGALHYLELFDSAGKRLHAAFSPCVPRVGDVVRPQRGPRMKVAAVEHVAVSLRDASGPRDVLLIPHVKLRQQKKRVD